MEAKTTEKKIPDKELPKKEDIFSSSQKYTSNKNNKFMTQKAKAT